MKTHIKIKKNINIGYTEIQKQTFHQYKSPISVKNIDVNKVV